MRCGQAATMLSAEARCDEQECRTVWRSGFQSAAVLINVMHKRGVFRL